MARLGTTLSSTSWTLLTVFLLFTACNVVVTVRSVNSLKSLLPPPPKKTNYSYLGEDHPSQLPIELDTVGLKIDSGAGHFELWDDEEWGTMFPSSGFIELGPHKRPFQVSFVHQLHCLDGIRTAFLLNDTYAAKHLTHCLRFLRQTILCSADTTLDGGFILPSEKTGEMLYAARGDGSVHRCKDWTKLTRYLVDNEKMGPPKTA
ncbi:hypothetical protein M422DRAFT_24677 [Sphaerobolus stellatus SS14]|nr:hypothetical protein M422DRAFT_24677 [Sphaerobolus stellatus SS14]